MLETGAVLIHSRGRVLQGSLASGYRRRTSLIARLSALYICEIELRVRSHLMQLGYDVSSFVLFGFLFDPKERVCRQGNSHFPYFFVKYFIADSSSPFSANLIYLLCFWYRLSSRSYIRLYPSLLI